MGELGLGRFTLLASAIAGRALEVTPGDAAHPAWTDGTTVFIDPKVERARQVCMIAVQASLVGAGSLDAQIMRRLPRRAGAVPRYLAVEGHRALAAQAPLLPASVRKLIDYGMAGRVGSPAASLALAASREEIGVPPAEFGTIRPKHLRDIDQPTESRIGEPVPGRDRNGVLAELDDGEQDQHKPLLFDIASPVGGGGVMGSLLKRLLSDVRSSSAGGGQPDASAPTHVTRHSRGGAGTTAASAGRVDVGDDPGIIRGREVVYPEWDVFGHRYRQHWCTVLEITPEVGASPFVVAPGGHALRRSLARLGTELERRHRQLQGDDLDIDAAVEARVDLLAGSTPDETIYIDTVRARRELSVLVLLDVSGSAGEPSVTGAAVHEHQRAAAGALTLALDELGDRVALYAFRSQGRSAVQVLPLKRFDDNVDALVLRRLNGLLPAAYTRLGAAIRHGSSVLEKDGGTARRLLIVISDGFAYDHGYEGRYGQADARRALAEARRRGTACVCLSLGTRDPADLRLVFGAAAHATIPHADQLARVVGPVFRSALWSAEGQQRVWQRKERSRERLEVERRTG